MNGEQQETNSEKPNAIAEQICSFRIVVIVTSDDEALAYKKQISAVFGDNANAQIQFTLSNKPPRSQHGMA